MDSEYTAERLMRLGADCNRDNRGASGLEIVRYAEAWEQERDALRAERDSYKYQLAEAMGEVPTPCEEVRSVDSRVARKALLRASPIVDSGWLTHDSNKPPADLAQAQLVELQAPTTGGVFAVRRVDELPWHPGLRYRPALSASGLLLCSAEGLKPWARWVATDWTGFAWQFSVKPWCQKEREWNRRSGSRLDRTPSTHRRPGPASESLMEVHRD